VSLITVSSHSERTENEATAVRISRDVEKRALPSRCQQAVVAYFRRLAVTIKLQNIMPNMYNNIPYISGHALRLLEGKCGILATVT